MREFLDEGSIDIAVGVASIHHHSKIPFDLYHEVLHPGGTAVFGDWHNSCWTHPALVNSSRNFRMVRSFT
ncbi:MAG: hypothetical protein R3A13_12670 [Bdellovibrionota bacterium]